MSKPPNQKFYKKINLCWYFIKVGSNVRCTFYIGWGLNMSYLSLNLKIQKKIASHHISILSLTVLSNLQISICLKFLVLNTGVIPLSQQWCHLLTPFSGRALQILELNLKWESWKKFIQGNLSLREELDTFLGLKNFIFHNAWIFLFGIKNKNVLICKNLCCFKPNLRSLMILMNWMVGQRVEPKHILYSPCGSSLLT